MRTDHQILYDVLAELNSEPSINAINIGVEVVDGAVTLSGHVETCAEKIDAEHAAQRVTGVRTVAIDMVVELLNASRRADAEILRATQNVLESSMTFPAHSVNPRVESGWVTLSGQVESEYQRDSAVSAVRLLLGVTGVTELIVIQPVVTSALVKTEIEAGFKRRAHDDAEGMSVEVRGSEVTLKGIVSTWSDRELAKDSAWRTPGVHKVVDNLTVAY